MAEEAEDTREAEVVRSPSSTFTPRGSVTEKTGAPEDRAASDHFAEQNLASRRPGAGSGSAGDGVGGLTRIRDILMGDILLEIERRLARLDSSIAHRSNDVQHDAHHRTEVLETYVRKEVEAVTSRAVHDKLELNGVIRELKHKQRDAIADIEQRLTRIEERLDSALLRVEREARDQLLAQAKSFMEQLEGLRNQLRSVVSPDGAEGREEPNAWAASH